jgi:hypothetical protein
MVVQVGKEVEAEIPVTLLAVKLVLQGIAMQ